MQTAHVLLSLGGDAGNQVMKYGVTAAEIAVLRGIHGDEAVTEVEPHVEIKRSHREERMRLLSIYGGARGGENKPVVEGLFPGAAARVFENLHELDIPESFFKATGRQVAAIRNDGPTIAEYVAAGYPASTYPPRGYASKSTSTEIAAAVAAAAPAPWAGEPEVLDVPAHDAPLDDSDDGVGEDIDDEHAKKDILG